MGTGVGTAVLIPFPASYTIGEKDQSHVARQPDYLKELIYPVHVQCNTIMLCHKLIFCGLFSLSSQLL